MKRIKTLLVAVIIISFSAGCSGEVKISAEDMVRSALEIFYNVRDDNSLSEDIYGYPAEEVREKYSDDLITLFESRYPEFSSEQNAALAEKLMDTVEDLIVYEISNAVTEDASAYMDVNIKTLSLAGLSKKYNEIYEELTAQSSYEFGSEEQRKAAYDSYIETLDLLQSNPQEFEFTDYKFSVSLEKEVSKLFFININSEWHISNFEAFYQEISSTFTGI